MTCTARSNLVLLKPVATRLTDHADDVPAFREKEVEGKGKEEYRRQAGQVIAFPSGLHNLRS